LSKATAAGFGAESDYLRRLRVISPELPSEFYDSVADRLDALDARWKERLLAQLRDAPRSVNRRRLNDHDALIGTMLAEIRSQG
jgi:hypothetical protein